MFKPLLACRDSDKALTQSAARISLIEIVTVSMLRKKRVGMFQNYLHIIITVKPDFFLFQRPCTNAAATSAFVCARLFAVLMLALQLLFWWFAYAIRPA